MTLKLMRLVIRPSGGDSLSVHSFEVRVVQESTVDGASDPSDATSWCVLLDNGVTNCQPSHDGTWTGWWGLGPYSFDGDRLTFDDPTSDMDAAFRRVGGAE